VLNVIVSMVVLSAAADAAQTAAPAPAPETVCRLVAEWDADHDLVAYEIRRDDCATPPPALTGTAPGRRRKSLFELYRISTGKLVDAADGELTFSLDGGEGPGDLAGVRQFRKTFAPLRPGRGGAPVPVNSDELLLPGAGGPAVVKPSPFGERVVAATQTRMYRFVVLARGSDEALLRLPVDSAPLERRQRDLLMQASVFADTARLDEGRPLVKAARDLGPLSAAMMSAFCTHADLARRIDNWRAATRDLDGGERAALETELGQKRCFGSVDLAAYDRARAPMAIARQWLDAAARQDAARMRDLSQFPLTLRGLFDSATPSEVAACGVRLEDRGRVPESTLEIAGAPDFDKAAPCLTQPALQGLKNLPAMRDGRWPPNRGYWFGGWVGTTLPTTLKALPRDLRRFTTALKPLLASGTPVQAVVTDNSGFTDSFVIVLVPGPDREWRVRAVFADERFEE